MRITSPILSFLAKALAAQAQSEPQDTSLSVPPVLLNVGSIPLPIQTFFGGPSSNVRNVTHFGNHQSALTASVTNVMTILSEGLWEVAWHHYLEVSGAVADITSVGDFRIVIPGLSGSPNVISRIRGTNLEQGRSGNFRIMVLKGSEVQFDHAIASGAGTSTSLSRVSLFCSRLL